MVDFMGVVGPVAATNGAVALARGEALLASAQRHGRIAGAVMTNLEKKVAEANEVVRRHLAAQAKELAQVRATVGATVVPPRRPWWNGLLARVKRAVVMLGEGQGRVVRAMGGGVS